jgi:uncharacterized membrane protein
MTTLAFLLAIAFIVAMVLAIEGRELRRPIGLLMWLVTGNWPAKIGAVLMVVGTAALLRYAAINIDVPPPMKLSAGVAIAALLGFGSMATGRKAAQRSLSLALGGAAFGVAYLTSYTAFALYGYLGNSMGLGLLMLTAVAAGVFAVTRSALSLALLSMAGAYLAPAFAVGDPGPGVVYGYYVAASALSLIMVAARGWRPLIQLSFLFTLVGGVFFAWNAQYYTPEYFYTMAPMLLALVALHVAMPIVERRHTGGVWIERLDLVYLLAVPLVATLLAMTLAPSLIGLSLQLICLGLIWIGAAAYLQLAAREGTAAHAVIGALLMVFGIAARFRGLPWDLISLAFAVVALGVAVRRSDSSRLQNFLAGVVFVLGAVHVLTSLEPSDGSVFANGPFFERLMGATLLIVAARLCRSVRQALDSMLLSVGVGWAVLTLGTEFIRWDVVSLALACHWFLIAAAIGVFALSRRANFNASVAGILAIAVAATAVPASASATYPFAIISLIAAPLAMIALVTRDRHDDGVGFDRSIAAIAGPVVAAIWAQRVGAEAPALVTLLWAGIGASFTVWSRKVRSRSLWMGGAALLVAAAVKVVLVDFGSLGDLANILAVMAAGGIFLLVGWLSPMPPAATPAEPEPSSANANQASP